MQITKINNTVSIELKNQFETPEILRSMKFFDRFNVELYNQIKKIKNEFAPVSTRIKK